MMHTWNHRSLNVTLNHFHYSDILILSQCCEVFGIMLQSVWTVWDLLWWWTVIHEYDEYLNKDCLSTFNYWWCYVRWPIIQLHNTCKQLILWLKPIHHMAIPIMLISVDWCPNSFFSHPFEPHAHVGDNFENLDDTNRNDKKSYKKFRKFIILGSTAILSRVSLRNSPNFQKR